MAFALQLRKKHGRTSGSLCKGEPCGTVEELWDCGGTVGLWRNS